MYARQRGHRVTLFEKEAELGGLFRLAAIAFPGDQLFLDWLTAEVERLEVDVRLGVEADLETVQALEPDAVIVATGGRFESPALPGDDAEGVVKGRGALDLIARIRDGAAPETLRLGEKVVIVGANLIGIELAELLARRGKRVHLLEPSGRFAMPAGKKRRGDHAKSLDRLGVVVNTGVSIEAVRPDGVLIHTGEGRAAKLVAGSVVIVGQPVARADDAPDGFGALGANAFEIGDRTAFGLSAKAAAEGLRAAYAID
jgi:2,4-dienoyl-CoA reductase (NADPH2)